MGRNSWEGRRGVGCDERVGKEEGMQWCRAGGGVATGKPHLHVMGDDFMFSIFLSKGEHEKEQRLLAVEN